MEEKKGGAMRSQRQMEDFRNAIHQYGFRDLGYCGPDYTWCNMQEWDDRVYLRLDRALATANWIEHYSETRVHHLVDSTSDHCALLITNSMPQQPPRKRRFHFEAMWTKKEDCKEVIKVAWIGCGDLSTLSGIANGLRQCAIDLSQWNKSVFGHVPKLLPKKIYLM